MSEKRRLEAARDLTPAGYAIVLPKLEELADLEVRWSMRGEVEAYEAWRSLLGEVQALYTEHYAGHDPLR